MELTPGSWRLQPGTRNPKNHKGLKGHTGSKGHKNHKGNKEHKKHKDHKGLMGAYDHGPRGPKFQGRRAVPLVRWPRNAPPP